MFIRFVVGADDENHRSLSGIFTEANLLKEDGNLSPYEEEWLEEVFGWFNSHLPCPPFAAGRFSRDAVAWFKADSSEFIARMWDIVALIQNHDVPVRLLKSQNPGKIVYEDDHQIVVEEWRRLRI